MSNILFLDKMQQVIKSYDSNEFIECVQTKEITTNASELMNDTLSVSLPFDETIKDASYIAVNDTKEQEFSLYRILTAKDEDDLLSSEAINFAVDELDNFIIKDIRPKNRSFSYVINQLLSDSGCDWVLGVCEPINRWVPGCPWGPSDRRRPGGRARPEIPGDRPIRPAVLP